MHQSIYSTFARIKLFNYNTRRYAATADLWDKPVKLMRQGVAHLRYFLRLRDLRDFILHWYDEFDIVH